MSIGVLTLHLHFPGCASLKEKRSRLKPILARVGREFNVSVAEVDRQDAWQEAVIAIAMVSNAGSFTQKALRQVAHFIEANWPDEQIVDQHLEWM